MLGSGSEACFPAEPPGGILGGYDILSRNVCLATTKLLKEGCHVKIHFYAENTEHPLF